MNFYRLKQKPPEVQLAGDTQRICSYCEQGRSQGGHTVGGKNSLGHAHDAIMGVGRIFCHGGGSIMNFPRVFLWWPKSGFFPLGTKKQPFSCWNFHKGNVICQNPGGHGPPLYPVQTPAHPYPRSDPPHGYSVLRIRQFRGNPMEWDSCNLPWDGTEQSVPCSSL